MAGLHRSEYGVYRITFYFDGVKICRSTDSKDESEAKQLKGRIERTLVLIKEGHLQLPEPLTKDILWRFLRSGGKQSNKPKLVTPNLLSEICQKYLDSYTDGTKEKNTLQTEKYHINHFCRILGRDTDVQLIDCDALTRFIKSRQSQTNYRGDPIQNATINKELQTFSAIWKFAEKRGWVRGENPLAGVRRPRSNEKRPFMTIDEVEMRISRGNLTGSDAASLWDCAFLREHEVAAFLRHVKDVSCKFPNYPFIYPAIAFLAYTGARRSEMMRCEIDDIGDRIQIREKKQTHRVRISFRYVPLHPELKTILDTWLLHHPGGQLMFCKNGAKPIDGKTARQAFHAIRKNSRWSSLRGYHVLRHSFASNLARNGVDQRQIDECMGHNTEESRKRYRHLLPEENAAAINTLSYLPREQELSRSFGVVG